MCSCAKNKRGDRDICILDQKNAKKVAEELKKEILKIKKINNVKGALCTDRKDHFL